MSGGGIAARYRRARSTTSPVGREGRTVATREEVGFGVGRCSQPGQNRGSAGGRRTSRPRTDTRATRVQSPAQSQIRHRRGHQSRVGHRGSRASRGCGRERPDGRNTHGTREAFSFARACRANVSCTSAAPSGASASITTTLEIAPVITARFIGSPLNHCAVRRRLAIVFEILSTRAPALCRRRVVLARRPGPWARDGNHREAAGVQLVGHVERAHHGFASEGRTSTRPMSANRRQNASRSGPV